MNPNADGPHRPADAVLAAAGTHAAPYLGVSAADVVRELTAELHGARSWQARALATLDEPTPVVAVDLAAEQVAHATVIVDRLIAAAYVLGGFVEDGEKALAELQWIAQVTTGQVDAGEVTIYDLVRRAGTFLDQLGESEEPAP